MPTRRAPASVVVVGRGWIRIVLPGHHETHYFAVRHITGVFETVPGSCGLDIVGEKHSREFPVPVLDAIKAIEAASKFPVPALDVAIEADK